MTKTRARLTELEGAILGVLRQEAGRSAYFVRRIFLNSRSAEWSGSAGAVYPALRRMADAGLLGESRVKDKRGTTTYALSRAGLAAHDRWLCDIDRAISPGMDPFRTRAALWSVLPPRRRRALLAALKKALTAQRASLLHGLPALDANDTVTEKMVLSLLALRLDWLKAAGA